MNRSDAKMECSICFIEYNDSNKQPYLLSCGHTFCISCIKEIRSWRCPNCDSDIIFETIKPNFSLIDVINSTNSTKRLEHQSLKQVILTLQNYSVEELVYLQEQATHVIIEHIKNREQQHVASEIKTLTLERNELLNEITEVTCEVKQLEQYLTDRKALKYSKIERVKEIEFRIRLIENQNIIENQGNLLDLDEIFNKSSKIIDHNNIDNIKDSNNMNYFNINNNNSNNINNFNRNTNPFENLKIPNNDNAFTSIDPFANI